MNKHLSWILLIILFVSAVLLQSCRKNSDPASTDITTVFDQCITPGKNSSFEVLTLNLQGFPKAGSPTVDRVRELIERIDPDLIALQEMTSETEFKNLLMELEGWEGRFYPVNNDFWNLVYLFKTSEVEIDDSRTRLILTGDTYAFPRAPFEIFVRHKTLKISAYLINIHLKCCSSVDNEARRRDASLKIDNYIKTTRASDPVIVLGDFNDVIGGETSATNLFYNFVSAPSEYLFTDMNIARGSDQWWSYPTYPSHIDHIMVTNELFSWIDTTMTLRPDLCYPEYFGEISDHRPLELVLK